MIRRLLALAFLTGLLPALALAGPPLAERLPAECTAYLGWAGRNVVFDGSMTGQMLNQPALKEMMASLRAAIPQIAKGAPPEVVEHVFDMLAIAWQHRIAVGISESPAGAKPGISGALLIDLGRDRQAFAAHLDALLRGLGDGLPLKQVTAGEVTYRTFQPAPDAPLFALGTIGDVLFLSAGAEMPAKLIALSAGPEKSLLNAPAFTKAYKEVAGENEQFVFYVGVPEAVQIVHRVMGAQGVPAALGQQMIAMGLAKITSVVGATRVVDRGLYTKTRLLSPAPHQGVLSLFAGGTLAAGDFAIAPADSDFVVACKLDPSALLAELRRVATAIDPKAAKTIDQGLAVLDKQLGLSLEKDLLAHVGGQMTLVSAPSWGGFLTGTGLVMQLKNPSAFAASVEKLENLLRAMTQPAAARADDGPPGRKGPMIQTTLAGKTKINYVQLAGMPVPVAPAWAVSGGKLVVALWPQVVQGALQPPKAGTLDQDPAFKAAFGRITGKPTIVCYANLPKIVRNVYGLPLLGWSAAANMLQGRGANIRADWLPPLSAVEEYLWPAISAVSANETGITFESYGSLPLGPGLAGNNAAAPLAVAVLLPALGQAREKAKEAMSAGNLNSIGKGIIMYKAENRDVPPKALEDLVQASQIDEQHLISPLTGKKAYIYIRLPDDTDGSRIVAYEDPATHGRDRTAVLFANGSVRTVPVDQALRDQIKASLAESEKAYGKPGAASAPAPKKPEGF